MKSTLMQSKSCHLPSITSYRPSSCRLRQTASVGQSPTHAASDSSQCDRYWQWQLIGQGKLPDVAFSRTTQTSDSTDFKPDQQLYCRLSSQMGLLQEKVDRQYAVIFDCSYSYRPTATIKCLRFGHWLTLCTLNIHLLT